MPTYDYYCEANGETVEVTHPIGTTLSLWGQVCYAAQRPLGDDDPLAPVVKVITRAPAVRAEVGPAELRSLGMAKLVRRGEGEYEAVTAVGPRERRLIRDQD